MEHWELIIFFFGIAMVYASVGFGGGSSYLAILALYPLHFLDIRAVALVCNIAVVGGSSFLYWGKGLIDWRRTWPIVITSIPLAFIGGQMIIRESQFFILLAILLMISGILMWFQPQAQKPPQVFRRSMVINSGLGGGIGLVSGMVGIGGGIFLSPLLHLLRWAEPKVIAATCAFFILVNSLAGLAGQALHPEFNLDWRFLLPLVIAVMAGGQIGSRLGISVFNQATVKRATAILVIYVSVRIFFKYLSI